MVLKTHPDEVKRFRGLFEIGSQDHWITKQDHEIIGSSNHRIRSQDHRIIGSYIFIYTHVNMDSGDYDGDDDDHDATIPSCHDAMITYQITISLYF